MVFYRNLVEAAFELAPDTAMQVVRDVVVGFEMPGSTIKDFGRKSAEIAIAGIYDLRLHHDSVIMPILRKLRVFERDGFGARGEAAREELASFVALLDKKARLVHRPPGGHQGGPYEENDLGRLRRPVDTPGGGGSSFGRPLRCVHPVWRA